MNPHTQNPTYSVIVLMYHRTVPLVDMARDCIASIKDSSEDYELIIVDNGSSQRFGWYKECDTYIRFNRNMGISFGWNAGLKVSRGKYKVILGDDTIVTKGYLEALREAKDMPDCGVGQIHVENLPQGVGIVENYKWPTGACFMLTQDVIDKVGYFDQDTYWPCNWEDWDYWLRVYQKGFKMYRNYHTSIQHREGATLHATDLSSHFQDNKRRFIKKHGFDPTQVFCGDEDIKKYLS